MQSFLYIFLLLISPDIFAGIFDPPPTDQSVKMLGMIFGSNIGNISLGGNANPVLSAIMEKFNFIIVTVGTIVVSYVAIMSTINTAQEGTAMGKKWSAVWIPMRSIAGMALMVPSPASGYSMIQVTVMWIILQGIGAADQIWNIALDGLSRGASAMIGVQPNTDKFTAAAEALIPLVLDAAVCMQTLDILGKGYNEERDPSGNVITDNNHTLGGTPVGSGDWLSKNASYIKHYAGPLTDNNTPTAQTIEISGKSFFGIDDTSAAPPLGTPDEAKGICGALFVTVTVDQNDYTANNTPTTQEMLKAARLVYDTKQLAISSMLTVLNPLAEGIVDKTIDITKPDDLPSGYFAAARDIYVALMSGLIVPKETTDTALKQAIKVGQQKGWIVAGSYYFVFNKALTPSTYAAAETLITNDRVSTRNPVAFPIASPGVVSTDDNGTKVTFAEEGVNLKFDGIGITDTEQLYLNTFLKNGEAYLAIDQPFVDSAQLGFQTLSEGSTNELLRPLMTNCYENAKRFADMLKTPAGGDPILTHAHFGRDMMLSAEVLWVTLIAITIGMSMVAWVASFWTGGGPGFMLGIVITVFGMVLPLLAIIWSMGAMLAIYGPLIPFMIFTTTAIGWILTVVEAIIGAPLIALGLVTPSGDELGKLETALMILANIFLKPMLMIFGFMLAGGVYKATVALIDIGMLEIFKTINVNTLFSWVVMIGAYISFVISCENTCFSLIYAVPDKILRWLGGPAEHTDTQAVQATKGMTQSVASGAGSAGSSVAGTGAKAVGSKISKNIANREEKEKLDKKE